jgi:sucrose-phosphate synthase
MQSKFKVSYYYDPEKAPSLEDIEQLLHQQELTANVLISFGQFLDFIPSRASLGQALRYTALRLDIPLEHMLVAGGSGNDEDMIRGNTLAVVIANRREEELSSLVDLDRVFFADRPHAAGLLDAIDYYDFFNSCKVPDK